MRYVLIGTIIASTAARPGLPARLEVHCEKGTFVTLDDRIIYWAIDGIDNPADAAPPANGSNASSAAVTDTARSKLATLLSVMPKISTWSMRNQLRMS